MRYQLSMAATLLAAALASAAPAQPLEDTIPVELARVLISPGQADVVRFHRSLPPTLPELDLPDGVTVLGGLEERNSIRAVLNAPPDAAQQRPDDRADGVRRASGGADELCATGGPYAEHATGQTGSPRSDAVYSASRTAIGGLTPQGRLGVFPLRQQPWIGG